MDIQTYMAREVIPGAEFFVAASALEISDDEFNALAQKWLANGGGDGFSFVRVVKEEQQSASNRLAVVQLRRDPA